jgi:Flagellar motor switch protein
MSKRAAEMLREEIEYLGPVRLRDVEEAQQRIVATIRRLDEAGEIIIARGGEDEIVV